MPKLFTVFNLATGEFYTEEKTCPVHWLTIEYALSIPEQIALLCGDPVYLPFEKVILFVQDNFVA